MLKTKLILVYTMIYTHTFDVRMLFCINVGKIKLNLVRQIILPAVYLDGYKNVYCYVTILSPLNPSVRGRVHSNYMCTNVALDNNDRMRDLTNSYTYWVHLHREYPSHLWRDEAWLLVDFSHFSRCQKNRIAVVAQRPGPSVVNLFRMAYYVWPRAC